MEERSFDDIIEAMMKDESWDMSVEERSMVLNDFAWTLNEL